MAVSSATSPARDLRRTTLRRAYLAGELSVTALVEDILARIVGSDDAAIWITRVREDELHRRAAALDALAASRPGVIERLPLFGVRSR